MRIRIRHFGLSLLFTVGGAVACSSEPPPQAPQDFSETQEAGEEDGSTLERANGEEGSGSEGGTQSETEQIDIDDLDTGVANVGDQETLDAIDECHEDFKFYNRFADDGGECTDLDLAKVNCDEAGIKDVMTTDQAEQFDEALEDTYEDWDIDQCLDCAPDMDEPLCKNDDDEEQVGTKVYFVKKGDVEVKGKAIAVPGVRPYQEDAEADDGGSEDTGS